MLPTAVPRAIAFGDLKPVVQMASVEKLVTIARSALNAVRAKNVVITNARIHVVGTAGLSQVQLSLQ